ncbi:MAG: beta strand repeat-containing protein [Caulobacteraceae bacterium]
MTTKTVTTYSASGYSLSPSYSELDITKTGGFGGDVYSGHDATLSNAGTINSTTTIGVAVGVLFGPSAGGVVINRPTGSIYGRDDGVFSDSTLKLQNYGTIQSVTSAVVEANAGGSVTNGNYANPGATIAGPDIRLLGTPGTVANFGTVTAFVYMNHGGVVTNGGVEDSTALIDGGGGIYIAGAAGTVSNFGTIFTYGLSNGVNLGSGGRVTNGAVSDTAARIEGFTGVILASGPVNNFGVIDGAGAAHGGYGVAMGSGTVTNGGGLDKSALIEGYTGVQVSAAAGTVTNFGTIQGQGLASGQYGARLLAGGSVTNGGGANRSALIEGASGVATAGTAATVNNFGTILATGATGVGVAMSQGALSNGSLNNGAALIEGYTGAVLDGSAASTNFGTISGVGDHGGWGVVLGGSESLVNAAGRQLKATVEGYGGVYVMGTANTLTNFATISGAGGTAVKFSSATDVLAVEAGCEFDGAVLGGGGTLDLASGTGTLSGLAGGDVTVSGSMAATTFTAFDTIEVAVGATFADSGAVTVASGQTLIAAGALTLGGAKAGVANAGTIETLGGTMTVKGAVTGKGVAAVDGGLLDLTASFTQNVTFGGTTGTLELAQSQGYAGTITGFSKSGGTSLDLADIAFGGSTKATYAGTSKAGVLTVTDGTHTATINLKGNYLSSTFVAASDGHGGTIVHDPAKAAVTPSPHPIIAAMAGLGAGGIGRLDAPAETWRAEVSVLSRPRATIA